VYSVPSECGARVITAVTNGCGLVGVVSAEESDVGVIS
jgi:hypothetical protein